MADDLRVDQLDTDVRKQKDGEKDHTFLLGGEIIDQEGSILGVGYFHGVLLTLKRRNLSPQRRRERRENAGYKTPADPEP